MSTPPESYKNFGNERINIRDLDLPPLTVEDLTKHYEIRERELVQWVSRRLEERILDWQEDQALHSDVDPEVYAFDAGFIAGLRAAIGITEELTSKLSTKSGS